MQVGDAGKSASSAARLGEWLRYYEAERIASIGAGVVTMRKHEGACWYRAFDGPPSMLGPTGDHVLERLRAFDLVDGRSDEAMLDMVFAVSPDARLAQECRPSPEGWAQASAQLRMTRGLGYVEEVDAYVAELVAACDGKRRLREAIAHTAARLGWRSDEAPPETVEIARQLVDEGFLLPTA
jgi:hypothetical protein